MQAQVWASHESHLSIMHGLSLVEHFGRSLVTFQKISKKLFPLSNEMIREAEGGAGVDGGRAGNVLDELLTLRAGSSTERF